MILVDISGASAAIRKQTVLTAGMVGASVTFRFDDNWEGLAKTAVFRSGDVTKDAIVKDFVSKIPHEVLITGVPLEIGVYGTKNDGDVVIPTVWAKTNPVKAGADPSGDEGADPSLPFWVEIQEQLEKGELKGEKGDKGDKGDPGEKGEKGDSGNAVYTEEEKKKMTEEVEKSVRESLSSVTLDDYVIEHGVADIWNWRKWASGVAEIWGTVDPKEITEEWIDLPIVVWAAPLDLPVPTVTYSVGDVALGLFSQYFDPTNFEWESEDDEEGNLIRVTKTKWQTPHITIYSEPDKDGNIVPLDLSYTIDVHMIGRWKPIDDEPSKEILAVNVGGGGAVIDDENISTETTWSSQKMLGTFVTDRQLGEGGYMTITDFYDKFPTELEYWLGEDGYLGFIVDSVIAALPVYNGEVVQ